MMKHAERRKVVAEAMDEVAQIAARLYRQGMFEEAEVTCEDFLIAAKDGCRHERAAMAEPEPMEAE